MDQVIRPGGVTLRDVRTLSFLDLIRKEHGIDPSAPPPSLIPPTPQQEAPPPPLPPPPPPSLFSPPPPNPAAAPTQPFPQPAPPPFMAPPAPPPATNFLEQARVDPGTPAPAPVPIVSGPSGGLIEAAPYGPAPEMPGYAQARSGSPFRPAQAPPAPNLFNAIAAQPYGQPTPATPEELQRLGLFGYLRSY